EAAGRSGELSLRDTCPLELRERVGKRLAWHALFVFVLAPAPEPVVLLREVGDLEVERERPQNLGLPVERQRADRGRERGPCPRAAGAPRAAGQLADALLVGEQVLAALLDEHPPERLAEQADVAPERGVGAWSAHSADLPAGACRVDLTGSDACRRGCSQAPVDP